MKVSDVPVFARRDTFYTLIPLNFVLKLFGLNCIYRDGAILKYAWSLTKTTFLIFVIGAMNAVNLYNKLWARKGNRSFQFRDAIQVVFLFEYFQYLLDLFSVYKYGRRNALQYFSVYESIDKILNLNNYTEIRRSINILLIAFKMVAFITCAVDFAAWFTTYSIAYMVESIIDYLYIIIRNLRFADVIAQVTQVSFRLRVIGDLLKGFYLLNDTVSGEKVVPFDKDVAKTELKKTRSSHLASVQTAHYDTVVPKLIKCYLLILEQNDYINTMYGVRILGMSLSTFTDTIMELNVALRIMTGSYETTSSSKLLPVLASVVRMLSSIFVLVYEVYRCEESYSQSNRIVRYIDNLLVNQKISFGTRETLTNLRSLVVSRPVVFHALNFYKLDYNLLLSFGAAVVTYTMILLQSLK